MKTQNRRLLLRLYGCRYRRAPFARSECFYCQDAAGEIDHCPPLSITDLWGPEELPEAPKHWLVPACSDCNQKLASRPLLTINERLEHVEQALLAEYERRATLWSDAEIREMSPTFQKTIRARRAQLVLLHGRAVRAQRRRLTDWDEELSSFE